MSTTLPRPRTSTLFPYTTLFRSLLLIASGEVSRLAPHVNVGYTYSHGDLSSSLTTLPTSSQPSNPATQNQINAVNGDRKSTRLNSSHRRISYAVFCLKQKSQGCV